MGREGWGHEKGQSGVKLSYRLGAWFRGRVLAMHVQVPEFDHSTRGGRCVCECVCVFGLEIGNNGE